MRFMKMKDSKHIPARSGSVATTTVMLLTFALLVWAGRARSEEAVQCDLLSIRATNTPGGKISPDLSAYSATLAKPPFSAFNDFRLIQKKTYTLEAVNANHPLELPSNMKGMLTYKGFFNEQFRLELHIEKAQGSALSTDINASAGKPFFIAGFTLPDGGTLVLGFICNKR